MGRNWIDGKTVVVTGASGGMGKGIAKRFIEDHNCTVIGIARSEEKMKKFVEELGANASKFSYQLFDVSKKENWESFAKYLDDNKIQIDVLVNNAGILPKFNKFGHYTIDEMMGVMDINFFSAMYSMSILMPYLLKGNNPAIINISSSASCMSLAGTSMYSASKAAVRAMTAAVREEYRGKLYVTCVCPGFTKTDIFRGQSGSGATKAFDLISTPCDKMVDSIVDGIERKKELRIYGMDAQFMKIFDKLLPVNGSRIFSAVMKMSKLDLFEGIFKD